jgi:hypothetical protein
MAFLRRGGRELSAAASDRLFRGLDRIEDTSGMYRLITLNMIGLVLERMGRTLEGDAGRLVQSYLTTCLTTSESRDFAKPLLTHMITDAGTKEPRSEADLAKATGFAPWQVKATLAELARQGLVRQLEEATAIWEIAHDFLARVIGQLIGRLKPSVWQRSQPLVAPAVLVGWIALAIVALSSWAGFQERAAEVALRQLGASFSEGISGGLRPPRSWAVTRRRVSAKAEVIVCAHLRKDQAGGCVLPLGRLRQYRIVVQRHRICFGSLSHRWSILNSTIGPKCV